MRPSAKWNSFLIADSAVPVSEPSRERDVEAVEDLGSVYRRRQAEADRDFSFQTAEELARRTKRPRDLGCVVGCERRPERLDHVLAGPVFEEAEVVPDRKSVV